MSGRSVLVAAAVLSLAGCGGGGGGGGSPPIDNLGANQGASAQYTATDLLGTWVQTSVEQADALSTGTFEWDETRRQTIIIENVSGVFRFRNCVADTSLTATMTRNQISFTDVAGLVLDVTDASTMTGTKVQGNTRTDISFTKVSSDAKAVLADVSLTAPIALSSWDQVCVNTVVDKTMADNVELKVVGRQSGVTGTVILKLEVPDSFVAGQYDYPADGEITGSYSLGPLGSGTLSDPSGIMQLVEGDPRSFYLDVVMTNGSDDVGIVGQLDIEPFWFEGE